MPVLKPLSSSPLQEGLHAAGGLAAATPRTGVYVGAMWGSEFLEVLGGAGFNATSAAASTGNTLPFLAGRVSYSFGLRVGPPQQTPHRHGTRSRALDGCCPRL